MRSSLETGPSRRGGYAQLMSPGAKRLIADGLTKGPAVLVWALLLLLGAKWGEYALALHHRCEPDDVSFRWKAVQLCGSALQAWTWTATDFAIGACAIVIAIAVATWTVIGLPYRRRARGS